LKIPTAKAFKPLRAPSLRMIWSLLLVCHFAHVAVARRELTVKLNKAGLICCGMYTAYFLVLIGFGYGPFADTKTGGLYIALATMPAALLLWVLEACLGFRDFPSPDSWKNCAAIFYAGNLVISYLFGWTLSAIVRRLAPRLDRLDERVLDRFDKDM